LFVFLPGSVWRSSWLRAVCLFACTGGRRPNYLPNHQVGTVFICLHEPAASATAMEATFEHRNEQMNRFFNISKIYHGKVV